MIATLQQQSCNMPIFSSFANTRAMIDAQSDKALIEALVEWTGRKPSSIAIAANLAVTTITRPLNQDVNYELSKKTLDKLKVAFPDFPGWGNPKADLPDHPEDRAYVSVRVLPSYAGMGGGGNGEGDLEKALLPRRLIEDDLRGTPADFELIDVRGDSMAPEFLHGDSILVDKRDRNPVQPGSFALFDGDGYVVKKVERVPHKRGWYRVFSANMQYRDYEIEETETTIIGRPVWFARRV